MRSNVEHYGDYLETEIAALLKRLNVNYIHESEDPELNLDFYLPDYAIYIEVKRFHSNRSNRQLNSQDNIILIQGSKSVDFLKKILKQY